MDTTLDIYKTLSKASKEIFFKEKKSKFFGYAFPIQTEDEVKPLINKIKLKHPNANHICYAWQLGVKNIHYRTNDDGEPYNSAGLPIYGQIQSFELTNILVAVVRVFGGVKLGVGGLINVYRTGAHMAIESSDIIEKIIAIEFQLSFDYTQMNKVMRIIKQKQLKIIWQKLEINCELQISVQKNQAEAIIAVFESMHTITLKKLNSRNFF